jgi:dienelactone hydrolase
MRRCRLNRGFLAALVAAGAAISLLAGCTSTNATASQSRAARPGSTSTTTTTLGVLPPATVNGLRVTPMLPPAGVVVPPATWLRVARPGGPTQLVAVYRPSAPGPHPVVLYLHGSTGLNETEVAWAHGLAERGFIVMAGCYLDVDPVAYRPTSHFWIPCPGLQRGEPSDPGWARPAYEALLDVASALPGADPGRLGVVGVSYGAIESVSINEPRVKAIVADSGYGKAGAGPVTVPVLLLGMQFDPRVMHSNVEAFEWMLIAAGKTVASHYYPGDGHVATLADAPMVSIDATNRAAEWLHRYLG